MRRPHVSTALSTAPPRTTRVTSVILLTMSLGVLIAQIDTSVVNLAVKQIGVDLSASVNTLQWVVDAYNLVYASLLLTAGTLADLYGRRKIFALGNLRPRDDGLGLFVLALIPVNDSLVVIEAALLVIGCGLGLNTGPVNAVAVANAPAARSGTASGLVNTARMVGATLGVAVLGALFAIFAGDSGHVVAGLAPAYIGGGIGEMIGAVTAFMFIRNGSLHQRSK